MVRRVNLILNDHRIARVAEFREDIRRQPADGRFSPSRHERQAQRLAEDVNIRMKPIGKR